MLGVFLLAQSILLWFNVLTANIYYLSHLSSRGSLSSQSPLSARQQVLMAVQDLAGKFNARIKSQSGDDVIVSLLKGPVS